MRLEEEGARGRMCLALVALGNNWGVLPWWGLRRPVLGSAKTTWEKVGKEGGKWGCLTHTIVPVYMFWFRSRVLSLDLVISAISNCKVNSIRDVIP